MSRINGISVVIPAFNVAPYVRAAILSALEQDSPVPIEVIVVDDGSTDGTSEQANAIRDSRLRVLCQRQAGTSVARNTGVANARYSWIAFHDGDDLWLPGKLRAQIAFLEAHPQFSLVGTSGGRLDTRGKQWAIRFGPFRSSPVHVPRMVSPPEYRPESEGGIFLPTVVAERAAILNVAGFRPGLRYGEDRDLLLKLGERYHLSCLSTVTMLYRVHPNSTMNNGQIQEIAADYAFVTAAQVARRQGIPEPDLNRFREIYKPTVRESRHLAARRMLTAASGHASRSNYTQAGLLTMRACLKCPHEFAGALEGLFRRLRASN